MLEISSFFMCFKTERSRGKDSRRLPNRISSSREENLERRGRRGEISSISQNSRFIEESFGDFERRSESCSIVYNFMKDLNQLEL